MFPRTDIRVAQPETSRAETRPRIHEGRDEWRRRPKDPPRRIDRAANAAATVVGVDVYRSNADNLRIGSRPDGSELLCNGTTYAAIYKIGFVTS